LRSQVAAFLVNERIMIRSFFPGHQHHNVGPVYPTGSLLRLTTAVSWETPWTGNLSGSELLDGVQRCPVTDPPLSRVLT
jgi:hypothetical protein